MSHADRDIGQIGCLMCGTTRMRPGPSMCRPCRRESLQGNAFDTWIAAMGYSDGEVAEMAKCSTASVIRAADGARVSLPVARALSKLTEIPIDTFRPPRPRRRRAGA
jgi:hypothetical protein